MWEYLSAPVDVDRLHEISDSRLWHARLMFLAWGIIAPLAVIVARFFKVLPGQDWPNRLDSQFWWLCHWVGQSIVWVLTIVAVSLMSPAETGSMRWPLHWHGWLGYSVVVLVCFQVVLGYFRGSKGGPSKHLTDGCPEGDHYRMSKRRRVFEMVHKSAGYSTLLLSLVTVFTGLWMVNAPRWMWCVIIIWWCILVILFAVFQRRGMAFDTYQAIWGPEPAHPGNRLPVGWGMNRYRVTRHTNEFKQKE
ncbi:cytochrome B [Chromatiales bacterium (ex Bugula neritina AB1)]|nr:cytochrome B [Chromatiales bacterium (ex Bugula neritina AB1)]